MGILRCLWRTIVLLIVVFVATLPGVCQAIDPVARGKIMDSIRAKNNSLKALPPKQRREQVVAFMKTIKEISHAKVSKDGNICCGFRDGMPYMIMESIMGPPEKKPDKLLASFEPAQALSPQIMCSEPAEAPALEPLSRLYQFQGNDLPLSTQARIGNTLGPSFGDGHVKIRQLLTDKGYQVTPGNDASIGALMFMGRNGVFYLQTHGGMGVVVNPATNKWDEDYILVSGSEWNAAEEQRYKDTQFIQEGLIGTCEAIYDVDPVTGKKIEKRYFTITKLFVKKYWKFAKNSFVFIHACTSFSLKDVMATADVNCSVFCGYNDLGNADCLVFAKFLFDRLLGANDDAVLPHEDGWPQRPFDYLSLDFDMKKKNLYPVKFMHEGSQHACSPLFWMGRDDFGLLAPSIKNVAPVPYQRKFELHGLFGEDPGDGNRSVTIGGVATPVDKWQPTKIVAFLPNSEHQSHGEVKVFHMGRPSNSRWLSNWKGTIDVKIVGNESLLLKAQFLLNFIGDPWPYRERPGENPVSPMVWNLFSCIGSTCDWTAAGEEKDDEGKVLKKWSGGGRPKVWLDENMGTRGTFGVGGVGDSYQKMVSFVFAIVDVFAFTEQGTTNANTPVKLGDWNQGQSLIQAKYDTDFGIIGNKNEIDDEPSRLSYGGYAGSVTWTSMQCRFPMARNAPR